MWVRMVVAMLLLLPFAGRLRPRGFKAKDVKPFVIMVAFMPCAYFFLETNALTLTSASQAGVISSSVPLLVALGARIFLAEPLFPRVLAGMALSMGGVAWLTLSGNPMASAPNPLMGNLLELGAMISAAGYMLVVKRLSSRFGPWTLTMMQTLAGLIFFLPGAPEAVQTVPTLPWSITLALIFLGTCASLGAFGLYNWALSKLPASAAAASINLVPVAAVFFGWALLNETLTGQQMLASACVLAGVFLSQKKRPRRVLPA
jgi:drug/metabolite transporter (DMT)-like permease